FPLVCAVEVVDHQETTLGEEITHALRLIGTEIPAADFDGVNPRPIKELVAVRIHHLFDGAGMEAGQALDTFYELPIGLRSIGVPARAAGTKTAEATQA